MFIKGKKEIFLKSSTLNVAQQPHWRKYWLLSNASQFVKVFPKNFQGFFFKKNGMNLYFPPLIYYA